MIQFKETGRIIEHVWSNLHECQLLDKRLDEVKKHLRAKYYVDYFSVNAINREKTHYISNMGHDLWHLFNWTSNMFAFCSFTQRHFELPIGKNELSYFEEVNEMKDYGGRIMFHNDLRLYYVQEQRDGCSIAFSTNQGVTQFSFTFEENKHLSYMSTQSYLSLIDYFKYLAPLLMVPFLEYFSRYNTLEDSIELEDLIREYPIRY